MRQVRDLTIENGELAVVTIVVCVVCVLALKNYCAVAIDI